MRKNEARRLRSPAQSRVRSPAPALSQVLALTLALLLLPFFGACSVESTAPAPDDLALAETAMQNRDTGDAEMHLERYLRKNSDGARRWEVWQKLLEISLNVRQDRVTAAEYLEIMLEEFNADPARRRSIQTRLAQLYTVMHNHARAVSLWEAVAADAQTPVEERAVAYRELSSAYLRRLEFTGATDVLGLCLGLPVRPETKAGCLYALAETQMLTEELPASEKALQDLLALEDIDEARRVAAIFMLADVVEQQQRLDEAETLLESIRDSYPNDNVVALRLKSLKEKKKAKKEAAPRIKGK